MGTCLGWEGAGPEVGLKLFPSCVPKSVRTQGFCVDSPNPLGHRVSPASVGGAEATLLGCESHKTWLSTSKLYCFPAL